jgi:hypothetical protein
MMRHKQAGRRLGRPVLGIILAFLILATASATMVKVRTWRVERTIGRFRAAPSQAGAGELLRLLLDRTATREQGARILPLLLRPEVTTRSSYPAGQPAKVSIELPFRIDDGQGRIRMGLKQSIWADERLIDTNPDPLRMLHGFPAVVTAWLRPLEPGTYHAEIRHECKVTDAGPRRTLLGRLWASLRAHLFSRSPVAPPKGPQTIYECRFTVPLDIRMVEPDRAERLELLADPQIGQAVGAAFGVEMRAEHQTYMTAAGLRECRGCPNISFQTLPVAVAFELSLRLPDGREIPHRPKRIRFRSGSHGKYWVNMGNFGIETPGDYAGTLVLRPDPKFAYEDPAIKGIWNGTLELPVTFSICPRTGPQ